MRVVKFLLIAFAGLGAALAIFFVFMSEKTVVFHPKGLIARQELYLIMTNSILMAIVLIPTFILLAVVLWKYAEKKHNAEYDSEKTHGVFIESLFWIIPSVIVMVMAVITWFATFKLDPYRPLDSEIKPLEIQVIALDWKWLFIYPEQGIATVNYVQFPENTPIHFSLSADGSPMNSFWIPQLSGQIYSMTGMITSLHVMADGPGDYAGRAAEINGKGYSDMTFVAKSTTLSDFDNWIEYVKQSPLQLTDHAYNALLVPSENNPIALYAYVETGLFEKIVKKYLHSTKSWTALSTEN